MRIVFIGYVRLSEALLNEVLKIKGAQVVGVITKRKSDFNSDFVSLSPISKSHAIPVKFFESSSQEELAVWIKSLGTDIVYCLGCSIMLKKALLASAPFGVVGYHPSALPQNRGRHPIIWTLALGLSETASTFFMMDEGADSGAIVSQKKLTISTSDNAASLYAKLVRVARNQIVTFTRDWLKGKVSRTVQKDQEANYWRKRGTHDGAIDWRMSARSIHNLVRALSEPYDGAHCVVSGRVVKVFAVTPVKSAPANLEPGLVLKTQLRTKKFLVKCGDASAVWVHRHAFKRIPREGDYLQ